MFPQTIHSSLTLCMRTRHPQLRTAIIGVFFCQQQQQYEYRSAGIMHDHNFGATIILLRFIKTSLPSMVPDSAIITVTDQSNLILIYILQFTSSVLRRPKAIRTSLIVTQFLSMSLIPEGAYYKANLASPTYSALSTCSLYLCYICSFLPSFFTENNQRKNIYFYVYYPQS